MTPKRIQRKRTKGWKMPKNSIYIGRPTIWGNPFTAKEWGQQGAVEAFSVYLKYHRAGIAIREFIETFRWQSNLVCWCKLDQPCHGDVLLEIINGRLMKGWRSGKRL